MDLESRDPKSSKKFLIPKVGRSQTKGNQHVLEPESIQGKSITSLIEGAATLQEKFKWSSKWSLRTITRFLNDDFHQRFFEKKQELLKEVKQLKECYAFGLTQSDIEADNICSKGAFSGQILNVPLGNVEQGVNVCRYPDVLLRWAEKKRLRQPCIIIYKILKGRCKTVHARTSLKQPLLDPTPNVDCHISDGTPTPEEPLFSQLSKSQMFLYEYDDDALPAKHPRQCLPYAVISFRKGNQSLPPASFTDNEQSRCSASKTSKELFTAESDELNNNQRKLTEPADLSTVGKMSKKSGHRKLTSGNSWANQTCFQLEVELLDNDEKENGAARKLPTKENQEQPEVPTYPARMKLSDRFANTCIAPSSSELDDPKLESLRQEHLKKLEKLKAVQNERLNNSLLGFGTKSQDKQCSFKNEHLKTSAKVTNNSSNKYETIPNTVPQLPSLKITINNDSREQTAFANINVGKNTRVSADQVPHPNSETELLSFENCQMDNSSDGSEDCVSNTNGRKQIKKKKSKHLSQRPVYNHGKNFRNETYPLDLRGGSNSMKKRGGAQLTRNRSGFLKRKGRMHSQSSEYFEASSKSHSFNMEEKHLDDYKLEKSNLTQNVTRTELSVEEISSSSEDASKEKFCESGEVKTSAQPCTEKDSLSRFYEELSGEESCGRTPCRGKCASCNNVRKRPPVPKPQDQNNWKQRSNKRTRRFHLKRDSSNNSSKIDSSLPPFQQLVVNAFEKSKRQNPTCSSPADFRGHNCDKEPAQIVNLMEPSQSDLDDCKLDESNLTQKLTRTKLSVQEISSSSEDASKEKFCESGEVKTSSQPCTEKDSLSRFYEELSGEESCGRTPCRGICASCNNVRKHPPVPKPQGQNNWKQRSNKRTGRFHLKRDSSNNSSKIDSSLPPFQQSVVNAFEMRKRQNPTCSSPADFRGHNCDKEPAQIVNLMKPSQSDLDDYKLGKSNLTQSVTELSVEEISSSSEKASNEKLCESGKVVTSEQPGIEEFSLSSKYEEISSEESCVSTTFVDDFEVQDMDVDFDTSEDSVSPKIPQMSGSHGVPSSTLPCNMSSQTNSTQWEHRDLTTERDHFPVKNTPTPNPGSWQTEFPQVSVPYGLAKMFPQEPSVNQNSYACVGPSSINPCMLEDQANNTHSCQPSEQSNWANEQSNIPCTSTAQYSQTAQTAFTSMLSTTPDSGCWTTESPQESVLSGFEQMFPQEPSGMHSSHSKTPVVGSSSAHPSQSNSTQFNQMDEQWITDQAHSFHTQSFGGQDSYTSTAQQFLGVPVYQSTNLMSGTTEFPCVPSALAQEPSYMYNMQSTDAPLQNNFPDNTYTSTSQVQHAGLNEWTNSLLATPNSGFWSTELSQVTVSSSLTQNFLQGPSSMQISSAEVKPRAAPPYGLSCLDSNTQNFPTSEQTNWIGQQGACTLTAPDSQAGPDAVTETISGSPNSRVSISFLKGTEEGICPPDQPYNVGSDSYINNPHMISKALEYLNENNKQPRVRRNSYHSEDSCTSRISVNEVEPPTKSKQMLFHGRPLLTNQRKKPCEVLLDNIPGLPKPVDPRAALSALFGRRFEIELKNVNFSIDVPCESVGVNTMKGTTVTHTKDSKVSSGRRTTRDPRLLKQIETQDINMETVLTAGTASGTDLVTSSVPQNQDSSRLEAVQSFLKAQKGNSQDNNVPPLMPNGSTEHQTGGICSSEKSLISNESIHDTLIPSNSSELEIHTEAQASPGNLPDVTVENEAPLDVTQYVPEVNVDNHVPNQSATDPSGNIALKVKLLNILKPSSSEQAPKPDDADTSSYLIQKLKHVSCLDIGTHPGSSKLVNHDILTGQESKSVRRDSSNEYSNNERGRGISRINSSRVESQKQCVIMRLSSLNGSNAPCDKSMSSGSSCTSSSVVESLGFVRLSPHTNLSSSVQEKRSTTYDRNQMSYDSRLTARRWTCPSRCGSPNRKSRSSSANRRSGSPCRRSRSPNQRSRSPCGRSRSPNQRSRSPNRRSRSPKRKSRLPYRRSRLPNRRSRSPNRSRSPIRRNRPSGSRSRSPRRISRSPGRRSNSSNGRSSSQCRRSRLQNSKSRSPSKGSRTQKRTRTPTRRSRSPCGRSMSPYRRSPFCRSGSSHSRSGSLYPRSGSPHNGSESPCNGSESSIYKSTSLRNDQDRSACDTAIHQGEVLSSKRLPEMLRLNDIRSKVESLRSISHTLVHVHGRHFTPFCKKKYIPCLQKYNALWCETNKTLKSAFERTKMVTHDDRRSWELVIESYEVSAADIHLQLESLKVHFSEADLRKAGIQNMDSRPISGVEGLTERGQLKVLKCLRKLYLRKLNVSDLINLVDRKVHTLQLTLSEVHTKSLSSQHHPEENLLDISGPQVLGIPLSSSIPHQGSPVMMRMAQSRDVTSQSEAAQNCSAQTEALQDIRRVVVVRNLGTEVHASHYGNRQGYRASNSTTQNADFQHRNI